MLNNHVAILLQFPDFIGRGKRSDGVRDIGSKANSVIENLDIMFADQISHRRFIWSADRDPISLHRKSPYPGSVPRRLHQDSRPGKDSPIADKNVYGWAPSEALKLIQPTRMLTTQWLNYLRSAQRRSATYEPLSRDFDGLRQKSSSEPCQALKAA